MQSENVPFCSIVIVNYNGGKYLEQAIKSVIVQNPNLYELIIIDGNSTDDSVSIINKYKKHIYYFISEPDSGQSEAFNKGFKKARGEYFFWLNSDDLLMPDSIETAFNYVRSNPKALWLVANTIFTNVCGEIIKMSRGPNWVDWAITRGVIYVNGPTSIFHRSLFTSSGGFDEKCHYSMDTDLWIRFVRMGLKFHRIDSYFWCFRIHEESKTSGTLLGLSNEKLNKEAIYIQNKNNYKYSFVSRLRQIFLKLITGTFFMSKIDSLKYKGMHINSYLNLKIK